MVGDRSEMKLYDWGFFFEDGTKEQLTLSYGPEGSNEERIITDLDNEWLVRVFSEYPAVKSVLTDEDECFAFVIVNPPRDGDESEVTKF